MSQHVFLFFHGQYALHLHEGISICVYIFNKQKERDIFSHCLDIFYMKYLV